VGKAVPTVVLCGVPAVAAMAAGAPARFVRLNCVPTERLTFAMTLKLPARVLAVKAGAVATPRSFVGAVPCAPPEMPPAEAPPAPRIAPKTRTTGPAPGLPHLPYTPLCRSVGKAVPTVVLCGVPAVAAMAAGAPARLVRPKFAGLNPGAEAVTVELPATVPAL